MSWLGYIVVPGLLFTLAAYWDWLFSPLEES